VRKKGIQGSVFLELVVDEHGVPRDIKVRRSAGYGLDEEVVKAVRKWRFEPATKDGQPVAVRINVEVNMKIR
jgi:periplasmic protein TonB